MKIFIISVKYLLLMSLLTGLMYPLFIFGIAKIFFPYKSEGSFIEINGNKIGSELIAQRFDSIIYFQPRPSSIDYLPMPSGASNLSPTSKRLRDITNSMRKDYIKKNFLKEYSEVPPDAIFSSGSGIDPHISPDNAMIQAERISITRGFNPERKRKLIELIYKLSDNHQFSIIGEPRINVLILNLELDKL